MQANCPGPKCAKQIDVQPGENTCPHCTEQFRAIMPQEGPQTLFLGLHWVDIVVYGGAAGGGKSYALLLDPVRDLADPHFAGVVFRREAVQITNAGGLWDTARLIYPYVGGKSRQSPQREWEFPSGAHLQFTHLQNVDSVESHQGGQYPWIGFDELTHFESSQFWYLVSRNRSSTFGGKRRIRATTNPDAGSWVKELLSPWLEPEHPMYAGPGEVRWLVRHKEECHWHRDKQSAMEEAKRVFGLRDEQLEHSVKSFTFVPANIYDNKVLMESDPGYLANLLSLDDVERARLLYGDWNVLADRFFGDFRRKSVSGDWWNEIPTGPIPAGCTYYLGVDWGFSDAFAAELIAIAPNGRQTLCREITRYKTLTSELGQAMLDLIAACGLTPVRVPLKAGHDVFNRRLRSDGTYDEPIAHIWEEQGLIVEIAGRDPLFRASLAREYIASWGPEEGWPEGRPGVQAMSCCVDWLRTMGILPPDPKKPEQVNTKGPDHWYDAWGHVLTSGPSKPQVPQEEPDIPDTRKKGSVLLRLGRRSDVEGDEYGY